MGSAEMCPNWGVRSPVVRGITATVGARFINLDANIPSCAGELRNVQSRTVRLGRTAGPVGRSDPIPRGDVALAGNIAEGRGAEGAAGDGRGPRERGLAV